MEQSIKSSLFLSLHNLVWLTESPGFVLVSCWTRAREFCIWEREREKKGAKSGDFEQSENDDDYFQYTHNTVVSTWPLLVIQYLRVSSCLRLSRQSLESPLFSPSADTCRVGRQGSAGGPWAVVWWEKPEFSSHFKTQWHYCQAFRVHLAAQSSLFVTLSASASWTHSQERESCKLKKRAENNTVIIQSRSSE